MSSQVDKKARMTKRIGTHNGTFHCDEALACFMLHQTAEFRGAEILRSRDPKVYNEADVVVDVGGVYDPATHRYDHHQREFSGTLDDNHVTKLSSAGLVYKHFGRQLLKELGHPEDQIEQIFQKVYTNFVEELDAVDNGISQTDGTPRYQVSSTLSARVGRLNPRWNEENPDEEAGFRAAMAMAGAEFLQAIDYCAKAWLPARDIVRTSLEACAEVHPSSEIMVLKTMCPWKEHLFVLEKEAGIEGRTKYVLFTDQSGAWRIQCVPLRSDGFENRKTLPSPWRGVRDEALDAVTGIAGCVFVHAGGFIGGNKTYEGALEMARQALAFVEPA